MFAIAVVTLSIAALKVQRAAAPVIVVGDELAKGASVLRIAPPALQNSSQRWVSQATSSSFAWETTLRLT